MRPDGCRGLFHVRPSLASLNSYFRVVRVRRLAHAVWECSNGYSLFLQPSIIRLINKKTKWPSFNFSTSLEYKTKQMQFQLQQPLFTERYKTQKVKIQQHGYKRDAKLINTANTYASLVFNPLVKHENRINIVECSNQLKYSNFFLACLNVTSNIHYHCQRRSEILCVALMLEGLLRRVHWKYLIMHHPFGQIWQLTLSACKPWRFHPDTCPSCIYETQQFL